MAEVRCCEYNAVGRIAEPGLIQAGEFVFFRLEVGIGDPVPCVCQEKTAKNALKYLKAGDETTIEGELRWAKFPDARKTLVLWVRYTPYGRKAGGLRRQEGGPS